MPSMTRARVVRMSVVAVAMALAPVAAVGAAGRAAAATDPPITTCTGTGTPTFTLSADCDTTATLTVPDGVTVDGHGHTITAHDPAGGNFTGPVITNATGATKMTVENLTVKGTGFAVDCGVGTLYGILFNDASGVIDNVTVTDITQHSGCPLGGGIRANALAGTPRTVSVTGAHVSGFQKSGIIGSGLMTLNVSGSIIGPPDAHGPGGIATNTVQYGVGGAGGMFTNNTVIGSGFRAATNESTAMLVFAAQHLTITHNTITGVGTDTGISVNQSTNVVLSFNAIGRTAPDQPDASGTGVHVDTTSAATTTLICNTFSGWVTNINGIEQPPCASPSPTATPTASASHSVPPPSSGAGTSSPFVPGPGLTGDRPGPDRLPFRAALAVAGAAMVAFGGRRFVRPRRRRGTHS
jgi:hypothetical protein